MNHQTSLELITLREYLKIFFRQKLVVLITFFSVIVASLIGYLMIAPTYEAQVTLLVSGEKKVSGPYYRETMNYLESKIALTQSEIALSNPVLERTIKALELDKRPNNYERQYTPKLNLIISDAMQQSMKLFKSVVTIFRKKESINVTWPSSPYSQSILMLRKNVIVLPVKDTNLLRLTVKDFSPIAAAKIANVLSRSYVIFDLEQQLAEMKLKYHQNHELIRQLKRNINIMKATLHGDKLAHESALGPASVKIIEQAEVPLKATRIKKIAKKAPVALGLIIFVAAFFSLSLAMLVDYINQTVKSPFEIEQQLKLPYLHSIPKRLIGLSKTIQELDNSNYVKAYRVLCDKLYLRIKEKKIKTIHIASTHKDEGVPVSVINMATFFARQFNLTVIVVDSDLRAGELSQQLNGKHLPGLAEVLDQGQSINTCIQPIEKNLTLLPAGYTQLNPLRLLLSERMKKLMKELKRDYNLVLINCAPQQDYLDAEIMARYSDGLIQVVRSEKTKKHVLDKAMQTYQDKGHSVLGVILNERRYVIPKFIYDLL